MGALQQIVAIVSLIVGVAILAVLVSKNSQTPAVISSFGSSVATMLNAATAPVTGAQSGMGGLNLGGLGTISL